MPESKRLNVLLREFRANRNHIAIVVDEYGGVSGLVTIEDVLEQIVGDIEDEYDFDESEDNIIPEAGGRFRVKAQTEIADFNAQFGTTFADEEFDTVGGLVLQAVRPAAQARRNDDARRLPLPRAARRQPPPLHAAGRADRAAAADDDERHSTLSSMSGSAPGNSRRPAAARPRALASVAHRRPARARCSRSRRSRFRAASSFVTLACCSAVAARATARAQAAWPGFAFGVGLVRRRRVVALHRDRHVRRHAAVARGDRDRAARRLSCAVARGSPAGSPRASRGPARGRAC